MNLSTSTSKIILGRTTVHTVNKNVKYLCERLIKHIWIELLDCGTLIYFIALSSNDGSGESAQMRRHA